MHNINGNVSVVPATGGQVEVTAVRKGRLHDEALYVAVKEYAGGVAICVLRHDTEESCDQEGAHSHSRRSWNEDASWDITVHLPSSLRIDARSVSRRCFGYRRPGQRARNKRQWGCTQLDELRASGVRAESVSGNVHVSIVALAGDGELSFKSVSGDVVISGALGLRCRFFAVDGKRRTPDGIFPLTLNGRVGRQSVHGRIGRVRASRGRLL